MRPLVVAAFLAPLAGCGLAEKIGSGPRFVPPPPATAPPFPPSLAQPGPVPAHPPAAVPSAGSLFTPGQPSLFRDARAYRVGDIMTVRVLITDQARVTNSTERQRNGSESGGVSAFFGLEDVARRVIGGAFNPERLVGSSTSSSSGGQGQVQRSETVSMTVAAVITGVLPNGNFVIEGRQQTRINAEMRDLVIRGLVRPQDVAPDNSVLHTQIADAQISYGGRGIIQDAQRPRWGQRVIDAISPF